MVLEKRIPVLVAAAGFSILSCASALNFIDYFAKKTHCFADGGLTQITDIYDDGIADFLKQGDKVYVAEEFAVYRPDAIVWTKEQRAQVSQYLRQKCPKSEVFSLDSH